MEATKEPADIKGKVEVTAVETIGKLRKLVTPTGKKATWMRLLNDKQLAEVYHRLRLKQSVYHVTKVVQKEWKIMPKSDVKSLCRAMKAFREQAIGLLQTHEVAFPQTAEKKKFVEEETKRAGEIVKKIDGMEELAWLITTQRGRLETLVSREGRALPFKFTDKTVETLKNCIDTYLRYACELGILNVQPKEYLLKIKQQFDGMMGGFSDGGNRISSAAERFLESVSKKAIVTEKGSDGVYRKVPSEGEAEAEVNDK